MTIDKIIQNKKIVLVTRPRVWEELGIAYSNYTIAETLDNNTIVIEDDYKSMGLVKGVELYLARRVSDGVV